MRYRLARLQGQTRESSAEGAQVDTNGVSQSVSSSLRGERNVVEPRVAKGEVGVQGWPRITMLLPDNDWPVLPDRKWQRKDGSFLVTFDSEEELYWTLAGRAITLRQRLDDLAMRLQEGDESARKDSEGICNQLRSLEQALKAYRQEKAA